MRWKTPPLWSRFATRLDARHARISQAHTLLLVSDGPEVYVLDRRLAEIE